MTDIVLSTLVNRRAELAGELEATQARTAQSHTDLAALDALIRQFDPAYPVDAIQTRYPRSPAGGRFADMSRTVLDVLRRVGEPLTIAAVTERVVALRGLDAASGAVCRAVEGGVGRALRHQRMAGTVLSDRKTGRIVMWELSR